MKDFVADVWEAVIAPILALPLIVLMGMAVGAVILGILYGGYLALDFISDTLAQ